jgi:hypothetical protein
MTEEEIRKKFFRNLETQDVNHALAETYREMSEKVLTNTCQGKTISEADRKILLKANAGLARLNLYGKAINTCPEGAILQFGPADFADLYFLYDTWEAAAIYLSENLEQLLLEGFDENYREEIKGLAAKTRMCRDEACENITTTETMIVGITEFELMYSAFKACWKIVLGKEIYEKLLEDRKQHITTIKNLYFQISSEVNSNSKPN